MIGKATSHPAPLINFYYGHRFCVPTKGHATPLILPSFEYPFLCHFCGRLIGIPNRVLLLKFLMTLLATNNVLFQVYYHQGINVNLRTLLPLTNYQVYIIETKSHLHVDSSALSRLSSHVYQTISIVGERVIISRGN